MLITIHSFTNISSNHNFNKNKKGKNIFSSLCWGNIVLTVEDKNEGKYLNTSVIMG